MLSMNESLISRARSNSRDVQIGVLAFSILLLSLLLSYIGNYATKLTIENTLTSTESAFTSSEYSQDTDLTDTSAFNEPMGVAEVTEEETLELGTSGPSEGKISYIVSRGDTFQSILSKNHINKEEQQSIISAISKVFNLRKLTSGVEIIFNYVPVSVGQEDNELQVDQIIIKHQADKYVEATRNNDSFIAKVLEVQLKKKYEYIDAEINSSLFASAADNNVPLSVLHNLVSVFSYDIDFERDIQPGDRFKVIYEQLIDENGRKVKQGKLAYASLTSRGQEYKLYGYLYEPGQYEYFDASGNIAKKALLKTPINVVRISSRFGMRKHPVLGYTKMHKGVDFAARVGEPVLAAGNGKVVKIGRYGSYGNYIKISHGGGYATAYAHLNGYAKNLKLGSSVKQGQVIGFVGTTGRSTGPHLHYEVMINGKHVNPLKVKLAASLQLSNKQLTDFKTHTRRIDQIIDASSDREVVLQKLEAFLG